MDADQNYLISEAVPDSSVAALSIADVDRISLCRMMRMRLLRKERDPVLQVELYRQLQYFSSRLPEPLGELEPMEAYLPSPHRHAPLLARFWAAVRELQAQDAPVNHARHPNELALNLPSLAPLLAAPPFEITINSALKHALKTSTDPRFVEITRKSSMITRKTIQCWAFEELETVVADSKRLA